MPHAKIAASAALCLALAIAPAFAAEEQHDQHHPAGPPPAAAAMPGMGQGMPGGGAMAGGTMAGMGGMPIWA
jgi:hypothetical protein